MILITLETITVDPDSCCIAQTDELTDAFCAFTFYSDTTALYTFINYSTVYIYCYQMLQSSAMLQHADFTDSYTRNNALHIHNNVPTFNDHILSL